MKSPFEIENLSEEIQINKTKSKKNKAIKIIALLLGIFLLSYFVSKTNIQAIVDQLFNIKFNFIFLIINTFIAYLLVSIAWMLCFNESEKKLSISHFFIIRLIGESLAQINPTNVIAGEAMKAMLLKRKGISLKNGIISLTISRFLIMLSSITLIVIGIYLFFDYLDFIKNKIFIYFAIGIIFLLVLSIVYLFESGKGLLSIPIKFLQILSRRLNNSEKYNNSVYKLNELNIELVNFYKTKKINFVVAYLLSFLHWIIGAVEFYLILMFLGINTSLLSCIAIEIGIIVFKALGAFIPGQIGIEEYGNKFMLNFVNVPGSDIWVTVSILRRGRQLFWLGIGLIASFIFIHKTKELKNGSIVYNS